MSGDPMAAAAMYCDGTYLRNNETWHVEDSAWKARHIAALLSRNGVAFGRACEVGCGAGEVLRQLAAHFDNAHFVGYELSPQAFRLCAERAAERVSFRHGSPLDDDDAYDCLLCIDVFEHVEDYLGFLRSLRPRAEWKLFHIPLDLSALAVLREAMLEGRESAGHLHYFTRDTALATLRDCGYEIVDHCYTAHFLMHAPQTWAEKLRRAVRRLLYAAAPDFAVRLWGGCSLLVLAK